jgi:hypothetical protein
MALNLLRQTEADLVVFDPASLEWLQKAVLLGHGQQRTHQMPLGSEHLGHPAQQPALNRSVVTFNQAVLTHQLDCLAHRECES